MLINLPGTGLSGTPFRLGIYGIGGAGICVLEQVLHRNPQLADNSCAIHLDARKLMSTPVKRQLHLGEQITKGLGSGGNARLAAQVAASERDKLAQSIGDQNVLILLAGLGGGTGSGVTPQLAKSARAQGVRVLCIAIYPFDFEGSLRQSQADAALLELAQTCDCVLRFDNNAIEQLTTDAGGVIQAFATANDLLAQLVCSIAQLALPTGRTLITAGLDDVLALNATQHGIAHFAVAATTAADDAPQRLLTQLRQAPLLEASHLEHLQQALLLVQVSAQTSLQQTRLVIEAIRTAMPPTLDLHLGLSIGNQSGNDIYVSLLGITPPEQKSALGTTRESVISLPSIAPIEQNLPSPPANPQPSPDITVHEQPATDMPTPASVHTEVPPPPAPSAQHEPVPHAVKTPEPPVEMPSAPQSTPNPDEHPVPHPAVSRDELGLFANAEPIIIDGEDMDLPPALRKKL